MGRRSWTILRAEQAFGDHPVHQGADGRVGPPGFFEKFFLDGRRIAGLVVPDGFDDCPLGFRQFNWRFWHGFVD